LGSLGLLAVHGVAAGCRKNHKTTKRSSDRTLQGNRACLVQLRPMAMRVALNRVKQKRTEKKNRKKISSNKEPQERTSDVGIL
jgi:hypothetical protein